MLVWILAGGVAMSALPRVSSLTLVRKEATLQRILLPLVAFATGSLLGGAFFHVLPAALESGLEVVTTLAWTAACRRTAAGRGARRCSTTWPRR